MKRTDDGIIAAIKKSFRLLEDSIKNDPIIFIDAKGKCLINDCAKDFLAKEGIPKNDFVKRVKIVSFHLRNFSYGNIGIRMMELPGKSVIALLRSETGKESSNFGLTRKERETLCHLVRGESNKSIADIMNISPGTVNTHLDSIYSKLGCTNRLSACLIALKNGLFLPSGGDRYLK